MNVRFYQDIDKMIEVAGSHDSSFSLWGTLWEFAEAMWLTGHEDG